MIIPITLERHGNSQSDVAHLPDINSVNGTRISFQILWLYSQQILKLPTWPSTEPHFHQHYILTAGVEPEPDRSVLLKTLEDMPMLIRVGYEIAIRCNEPTPMTTYLNLESARIPDIKCERGPTATRT